MHAPLPGIPYRDRGAGSGWAPAVLVLLVCLLAVVGGLLAGLGSPLLVLPVVAVIGACVLMFSPTPVWLWAIAVLSLLVVGPTIYFARIESARWLVPALALGMALPALLHIARPVHLRAEKLGPWPGAFVVLALFLAWAALSTAINRTAPGDWLGLVRYYLMLLPLILLLGAGALPATHWRWLWLFYAVSAVIQLPVAAVQRFVFAARQVRSAEWDAVVGTFPGQAEGGGASAAMGVYLVIASVFALMLWRHGLVRARWAALIVLSSVATLALAEVKAVALLLVLAAVLVFADQLRRRPIQFLLAASVAAVTAVGMLQVYERTQYDSRSVMGRLQAPRSPWEAIGNQFDPDASFSYTGQLGRVASFVHWWEFNVSRGTGVVEPLAGHGASATQLSRLNVGELVGRFRHPLNQTGTGVLLWEVGLAGHLLLVLGLLLAAHLAWRTARRDGPDAWHRALLKATAIGLVLMTVTLPYKAFLFSTAPSQVLLAMLLGYAAYASRRWPSPTRRSAVTQAN